MLKTREQVIETIKKSITAVPVDKQKQFFANTTSTLKKEYNISISVASDFITDQRGMEEASDFFLYAILNTLNPKAVTDCFSPKEIKKYKNQKVEDKKLNFPIKFEAIQIAEDQWLSTISAQRLMQFRDCQVISYNENTQRTMTRSVSGGIEHYKITLNRKAVEGIKKSYLSNAYIPNTITLNIPEDADFDYQYDEELGKDVLIINSIDHFDILDGYHRYIALSEITTDNPSFDYSMELRLVTFPEEKARQFIWQEDQKTKMSKIDSATFNQFKVSNVIVQRLNSTVLRGEANTNEGKINSGILANILDFTFAKDTADSTRSQQLRLAREVETAFKELIDNYPHVLDEKWNRNFTICSVYCLYNGCFDLEKINMLCDKSMGEIGARLGQKDINRLDSIWERMGRDVR